MFKNYALFLMLFSSSLMISQTVSTVTQGSFTDALALDSQGNVYGSDWGGNTVYKYSTSGQVSVFKNGFSNPNGIGVNASDEIFICDHTANRIFKYNTNGDQLAVYTGLFVTPAGIKRIPNTTDMLVVEYGGTGYASRIKKLAADGTVTTLFTGTPLNGPAGIAFIGDTPYIANFNDRKIFKFENGSLTEIAQLQSEGPGNLNFLGFLSALDGQLIATHMGGNKIYKIDPSTGTVSVYSGSTAGSADGDIATATFTTPNGIIGDESNSRIYVSDLGTKNLRIINNAVLSTPSEELMQIAITTYPNPSKDSLKIRISGILHHGKTDITVCNLSGKEVMKKSIEITDSVVEEEMNTSSWETGIYFISIQSDGKSYTKKIVIE